MIPKNLTGYNRRPAPGENLLTGPSRPPARPATRAPGAVWGRSGPSTTAAPRTRAQPVIDGFSPAGRRQNRPLEGAIDRAANPVGVVPDRGIGQDGGAVSEG